MLDGAFTIYRRQFASLFLTALLPQVPVIALITLYTMFMSSVTNAAVGGSEPSAESMMGFGLAALVIVPLAALGWATAVNGVTFQTARAYTGTPVTTQEALRRGFSRSVVLLVAYFLLAALSVLGLCAFIVGAFVVWVSAFAVAPAVVLEQRGPIEAISRSWQLIKGAWGEVFLVMFIAGLIGALPGYAVGTFVTFGGWAITGSDPDSLAMWQVVGQVLSQLASTLTVPFSIGTTVLLYYDRRVRSEALDVQMMAESLAPSPTSPQPAGNWG